MKDTMLRLRQKATTTPANVYGRWLPGDFPYGDVPGAAFLGGEAFLGAAYRPGLRSFSRKRDFVHQGVFSKTGNVLELMRKLPYTTPGLRCVISLPREDLHLAIILLLLIIEYQLIKY